MRVRVVRSRAKDRLSELEAAPRRRRNTEGLELARRDVASNTQDVATRTHELAKAQHRATALDQGAAARAPLEERLAVLEGALDAQVERAVDGPAPYLRSVLGPEPTDAAGRSEWRAAARAIAAYRHEELGLGPDVGSLGEEGPEQALGARLQDNVVARRWEAATALLPGRHAELAVNPVVYEPPGLDL